VLAELLQQSRLRVRANPLSYNTAIGLPLAILGRELDTQPPARLLAGLAKVLWTAYGPPAPVDVMVLELGVRSPGDMRAHLELVRPDIAVVTPLAPSFSEDGDALATLRREMLLLCKSLAPPRLLLCMDDPFLADLAGRMPGAIGFASGDVAHGAGGLALRLAGSTWPVGRDVVGASHKRALSAAARVGSLLGLGDRAIAAFLAGGPAGNGCPHP
jgi:UDP-N-acetylmuramyl pentapeptide synthase